MAKSEKEKLSLTSDMDVDTDRTCEVEVSYGGEADLHKHLNSCKKNPGHQNFVPVDQFSMEHLPSDYKNNDLLDLIRVMSDLTMRLSIKYVSDQRPKTWPGTNAPYPFCTGSPRSAMRTGTGWVHDVNQSTSQSRCSRCNGSSSSDIKHGAISVRTAAHVVFDEQEGQHTTCHLFFDKGGTPDLCPGVVTMTGTSYTCSFPEEDLCCIEYMTCDFDLIDRLEKKLELFQSLGDKLCFWLRGRLLEKLEKLSYSVVCRENLLCVIVSHPHGCSKQVSVGYCKSRTMCNEASTLVTYTTPTCPGSSGALVFLPGNIGERQYHVHFGICEDNKTLNRSSEGGDYYYETQFPRNTRTSDFTWKACRFCFENDVEAPTLLQLPMNTDGQGPWEVEVSYGGETELHQRYDTCEKNQVHQKLIPLDQFNKDHLLHQQFNKDNLLHQFINPELVNLIQALSDLTVRVLVKSVSDKRPDDLKFLKTFSDDEEQPDSCYRDSSRNMMLTGTGCVAKVIKYENSDEYRTCSCKECQMSQTPKTEFAHIYILTAIQVVYDNFEAEHSTCDFFFDRGHTPDTCPGAVTLSEVAVEDVKDKERKIRNLQYLICVTHDLGLADRLTEMIKKYKSLPKIIMGKIKKLPETDSYIPDEEIPVVIVSHPHGRSKRVSVGYGGDDNNSYTTPTCPGSAGAQVLWLSKFRVSSFIHVGECEVDGGFGHGEWIEYLS